jgi:hypothetical protein
MIPGGETGNKFLVNRVVQKFMGYLWLQNKGIFGHA